MNLKKLKQKKDIYIDNVKEITKKHKNKILFFIFLLGFVSRLIFINKIPFGLNQDEASAGYDAFALLNYGMDRNGYSWPVLFKSWGSGQNVLLSYLSMPFIFLFGLSELVIKLPNAIFSCISLVIIYKIAKLTRDKRFAIFVLITAAFNPWSIMSGRWALESNLFPSLLIIALYFIILAVNKKNSPKYYAIASIILGISLYSYGTAFIFLFFYILFMCFFMFFVLYKQINKKNLFILLISGFCFILVAMPIILCQIYNIFNINTEKFLFMSLPKLTQHRYLSTTILSESNIFINISRNIISTLFLFLCQTDGLIFNSMGILSGGIYYFFGLPLGIIGITKVIKDRKKIEFPILAMLLSGLLASCLIRPNINRLNMLWGIFIYFMGIGLGVIYNKLLKNKNKNIKIFLLIIYLASIIIFFISYIKKFSKPGDQNYFPRLGEAIIYADSLKPKNLYITNKINQPSIFVLFYTKYDPKKYISTVKYYDENSEFRLVKSFGHYSFDTPEKSDILIIKNHEFKDQSLKNYKILRKFGDFLVCKTNNNIN